MKSANLILVLILAINFCGCAFIENDEVEAKLTKSVDNFHALFNQENFNQIYSEADDELKNKFDEQQFVSYLEVIKANDVEKLKEDVRVFLNDDLKDAAKRIVFKKTKFSNIELVFTEKAMFREKFEWNLKSGEPKLSAYVVEKICDKPCRLVIETK